MPGKLHVKLKIAAALVGLTPILASAGSVLKYDATSVSNRSSEADIEYNFMVQKDITGNGPQSVIDTTGPTSLTASATGSTSALTASANFFAANSNYGEPDVETDTFFAVSGDTVFNITGSFTGSVTAPASPNATVESSVQLYDETTSQYIYNNTVTSTSGTFSFSGTLVPTDLYLYSYTGYIGGANYSGETFAGSATLSITGAPAVPLPAPLYSGLALLPCAYLGRRWTAKSRG